ncbi:unnamed protein product, partial [Cylicocyclus nassatus]
MSEGDSTAMVIVTSARTHTKIPRGSVVGADEKLSLPVLCSRPAEELPSYVPALMEKFSELGLKSYIKEDRHNKKRPFFVLREYCSFDMSEEQGEKGRFAVGTKRLHKGCSAFLNGYAASPLDFKNVKDFKDILKDEKVNIVSVPGRRKKSETELENEETCEKGAKYLERNHFEFISQDEKPKSAAEKSAWDPKKPDRTCADTPRIALGFSQKGLVDIPATARHFTVCTYGAAPPKVDESKLCHFAATFENGKCKCKSGTGTTNIEKRFKLSDSDKKLANDGKLCLDCEMETYHSLVILLDFANDGGKADIFADIATQMIFPFFATESYITLIAWGPNYDFQSRDRYGLADDGKNYDY